MGLSPGHSSSYIPDIPSTETDWKDVEYGVIQNVTSRTPWDPSPNTSLGRVGSIHLALYLQGHLHLYAPIGLW